MMSLRGGGAAPPRPGEGENIAGGGGTRNLHKNFYNFMSVIF